MLKCIGLQSVRSLYVLQGQLKDAGHFATEVNLMHYEIQESQEVETSVPLTLILTKTHTRTASGLAPDLQPPGATEAVSGCLVDTRLQQLAPKFMQGSLRYL